MDEMNEKPRRYKWPWFVLAAFVLFVLLAILWMSFAVRTIKQERNPNATQPTSSTR
jgi:cell division septal protein FtsQ